MRTSRCALVRFLPLFLLPLALDCAAAGPASARRVPEPSLAEVVARHTRALGGAAAIEGIDSLRYELDIVEPAFTVRATYVVDRLGRMRIDVYSGEERVFTEAFDGRSGWQLGGDGEPARDATPEGSAALWHGTQYPTNILGLHEMAARGHRVELAGGHALRLVLSDGWEMRYTLDPATHLITRAQDERALHPDLDPTVKRLETVWSDYRPLGGTLKPFRSIQIDLATGQVLQTATITKAEVNPPLEPALFARPS